jgi:hypothetical protein
MGLARTLAARTCSISPWPAPSPQLAPQDQRSDQSAGPRRALFHWCILPADLSFLVWGKITIRWLDITCVDLRVRV